MKNKFEIIYGKVFIQLSQGQVSVISLEDFNRANELRGSWYARYHKSTKSYYAVGKIKQKTVLLHRWIMNITDKNIYVDHFHHDTLNNTRDNLRPCSYQGNTANSRHQSNRSSKYKGVTWDKSRQKWGSKIGVNSKTINIGRFKNELDAAVAYNKAAVLHFGDFALLNAV